MHRCSRADTPPNGDASHCWCKHALASLIAQVLALRACVHGNAGAVQAATDAGLVQSLVTQLDDGPESEVALLAVQALLSLGIRELHAQEAAVKRTEGRGGVRVATLRRVWTRL